MDQHRLTLDNPVFSGRLRQQGRSTAYVRRPTPKPAIRIHDISAPVMPKPIQIMDEQSFRNQIPLKTVKSPKYHFGSQLKPSLALYGLAGLLFVVGLAVSIQGFRTNHVAQAQVNKLSTSTASGGNSVNPPPSTIKPSAYAVSSYQVAPDLPRYIDISSIKVHARVLSVSITKTGALATPNNVFDAAWYNASSKPGQPGAMLIDGHISSWTAHGVFYSLNKLVAGNTITITRGDGTTYSYTVVKTQVYDADSVDMSSLLVSADTSKPGLNLISCSGDVIPGTNEFNKRIAVFAVED